MELNKLIKDERAVSPVIGVILMVAITVILAAVIGTFVLGLGNNLQQTSPNANFQFEYAGNAPYDVTATHEGGATIDEDNAGSLTLNGTDGSGNAIGTAFTLTDGVSSGDSATLAGAGAGTDVRVVWTAPNGGNSQSLAKGEVPS